MAFVPRQPPPPKKRGLKPPRRNPRSPSWLPKRSHNQVPKDPKPTKSATTPRGGGGRKENYLQWRRWNYLPRRKKNRVRPAGNVGDYSDILPDSGRPPDEEFDFSSDGLSSIDDEIDEFLKGDAAYQQITAELRRWKKPRRLTAYQYAAKVFGNREHTQPKAWFAEAFGVHPAKFRMKVKGMKPLDKALTLYVRMNWVMYTQLGLASWAKIPQCSTIRQSQLWLCPSPSRITGWELAGALRSTAKRFKRSSL